MSMYSRMVQELGTKYNDAESSVKTILDDMRELKGTVDSINFFDPKGLKILDKLKDLRKKLEELSVKVNGINSQIDDAQKDAGLEIDESDTFIFNALNKQAVEMNNIIRGTEKRLMEIQSTLTSNNLWATFADIMSEIQKTAKKIAIKVVKVTVKAVKEVKQLAGKKDNWFRKLLSGR